MSRRLGRSHVLHTAADTLPDRALLLSDARDCGSGALAQLLWPSRFTFASCSMKNRGWPERMAPHGRPIETAYHAGSDGPAPLRVQLHPRDPRGPPHHDASHRPRHRLPVSGAGRRSGLPVPAGATIG
jgi:hypothetical protein